MTTRTFALSVEQRAIPICSYNAKRTELKVFNLAGNTVYILSAQSQEYTEGYPVTSAIPYEAVNPTDELWIVSATGTNDVRVKISSY